MLTFKIQKFYLIQISGPPLEVVVVAISGLKIMIELTDEGGAAPPTEIPCLATATFNLFQGDMIGVTRLGLFFHQRRLFSDP